MAPLAMDSALPALGIRNHVPNNVTRWCDRHFIQPHVATYDKDTSDGTFVGPNDFVKDTDGGIYFSARITSYNVCYTKLLRLLYQGARAFTIWTGREPNVKAMRKALQASVYGS